MIDRADLPLACFGKLPFWPEYLEIDATFATSRALKEWVRRGREYCAFGRQPGEAPPPETVGRRFLAGMPGSPELIAGVVRPSADLGGLRSFPFAAFVHVPRRLFGREYHLAPIALEPVFDALEPAWIELARATDQDAFRETASSLRIPAPLPSATAAARFEAALDHSIGRLFENNDGVDADALAANLPRALAAFRDASDTAVLLQLPAAAAADDALLEAAFWIHLVNRTLFFRRIEPAVFLGLGGTAPLRHTLLASRAFEPAHYAVALGVGNGMASVFRPADAGGRGPAFERAQWPTFGALLGRRWGS